ncbi:MAG: spore photoproduct lyase [Bacillota bacterium]|nr:spore photoproduct lyase [Bacillota bacterium]MDW7683355.1 spore photoproduct lyase [Bacillota bacterium]
MQLPFFMPKRVLFEERALAYPLGKKLWERFRAEGKEIRTIGSHNRVSGLPGETPAQKFRSAKETLVVGVRKTLEFASCRPSSDFQLVMSTSCPGMCEYCYLHTTLGARPVVRLYVNIDEILSAAAAVIDKRKPAVTIFEGAATSDPIPLEPYSGALAKAINFFAGQEMGRFRFVTKFSAVDSLLNLEHRKKTEFRFSVNMPEIIRRFEHGTPPLEERIRAAVKVFRAGYPLGFLIAPVFLEDGWREGYSDVLAMLRKEIPDADPSFEVITHRFTTRAKANIEAIFPASALPLEQEERRFKYGQFGYGKYIYLREEMKEAEDFFAEEINRYFPAGNLLYFV